MIPSLPPGYLPKMARTIEEKKASEREYYRKRRNDPVYRANKNEIQKRYIRNLRENNPEKYTAALKKRNERRDRRKESVQKFGITLEQYAVMFAKQNGLCAICKRPETALAHKQKPKNLSIDHDHATDKVRELLCSTCNTVLGMSKEDILILEAAISYLKKHKDTSWPF
jgi:hypothetical protein